MVVPLKLTQFYGHRVPRPRIYPDVKFNDQRVDPPPSVNDALLSWASDAHWSMGGLSSKRYRSQGKMEGNVRRLRALMEEDEDENAADMVKGLLTELKKPINASENRKCPPRKESSRSVEKRRHGEEELVEVTPARKLRRRGVVDESDDDGSPVCVPATEERSQRRAQARSMSAAKGVSSSDVIKGVRSPLKGNAVVEIPSVVRATKERRKGKLVTASPRSLHGGSKGPGSVTRQSFELSPASDGGRLTRSAKATAVERSPLQPSRRASRARKVLMASDGESSESDDGLEEFLKEKDRPLRRSTRLVKAEGRSFSGSESD